MSLGSQLNQLVDNPFFGIINNGTALAQRQISRAQLLRPYPQFTDIIPLFSSGASSNYHSLQVNFSKRFSHGLQIEGNYTWAKNIEEGENHQDSYNIRDDRAIAGIDLAHRFVIGYLYELPFGKGRKFGAKVPGVVDALIGGWQINGITSFISGTPLSISANNTAGLFNPQTRPNTNGRDPRLSGPVDQRLNKYFDTTVYTQPAPFTFGNVRRDRQHPQRRRQELRPLAVQTVHAHRAIARAISRRSPERLQHSALRLAEYRRHFEHVRTDHIAGQFAAAIAVWAETVVVIRPLAANQRGQRISAARASVYLPCSLLLLTASAPMYS